MLYNGNRPPSVGCLFRLSGPAASGLRRRRIGKHDRDLSEYKLYVAERNASKEYLSETKREILDSIRDLARRIEHP